MPKKLIHTVRFVMTEGEPISFVEGEPLPEFLELEEKAQELFANPLILLLTKLKEEDAIHFFRVTKGIWDESRREYERGFYAKFLIYVLNWDIYTVRNKKR